MKPARVTPSPAALAALAGGLATPHALAATAIDRRARAQRLRRSLLFGAAREMDEAAASIEAALRLHADRLAGLKPEDAR